jgi:SAM-dependent methyltransferase
MGIYRKIRGLIWRVSVFGFSCGPHITRYYMYDRLRVVGSLLNKNNEVRVLAISHSDNLVNLIGLIPSEVVVANYPEHNILELNFPDASFDYVLSDQVLEHVEGDPCRAISECYRVLAPGGIAVHTTCLMNPIHGSPKDFWRFTPEALGLLHRDWSEIIEVGGWGNFKAWSVINDGMRFLGIPHAKWHPLHYLATYNNPLWPIVTWIVVRK